MSSSPSSSLFKNATRVITEEFVTLLTAPRDVRTQDWFLAESFGPLLAILGVYLFFCIYGGPRYMRNRKPFELKNTLLIYNAVQVALSCVLFYEFYVSGWGHYNYRCQPISYDTDPNSMRMARAVWLYYIAKITELLDTVFFVLRKRDRQITFLHLYHHASMPFVSLIGVQYYAGGHGTIVCFVNSFIHIVMYAYYLLAAMGPKVQKYLWWKKYITMMQIVQFLIVFVHTFQVQFQPTCHYPKLIAIGLSLNASLFIYLFSSFYIQSYKKDAVQNGVKKAVSQKQD
uniref:Elongation of very long chain fatty acids protein n=1 Tax=Stomoxys calcitrans TaxID=35570 RepID=A0A1I8PU07_STOCA